MEDRKGHWIGIRILRKNHRKKERKEEGRKQITNKGRDEGLRKGGWNGMV